jgi:RNA polymerase sigma factor (sigma-70 family)
MTLRVRPPLTPSQQANATRCYPIAVRLARYYARRCPPGVNEADLLSEANEALMGAVSMHDGAKSPLENYVWLRVRGALKNLIHKAAKDPAGRALDDYALDARDDDDPFEAPEDTAHNFGDLVHDAATALAAGAAGHAWHTRGEEAVVLRAEYVRAMKQLHNEVARLPPAHATIVELRYFRELPIDDVAATAGCSPQKVPRLLADAIRLLRARLRGQGITGSALP